MIAVTNFKTHFESQLSTADVTKDETDKVFLGAVTKGQTADALAAGLVCVPVEDFHLSDEALDVIIKLHTCMQAIAQGVCATDGCAILDGLDLQDWRVPARDDVPAVVEQPSFLISYREPICLGLSVAVGCHTVKRRTKKPGITNSSGKLRHACEINLTEIQNKGLACCKLQAVICIKIERVIDVVNAVQIIIGDVDGRHTRIVVLS